MTRTKAAPKPADPFAAILGQSDRMDKATRRARQATEVVTVRTIEVPVIEVDYHPDWTFVRSLAKRGRFTPCSYCGDEFCSGCAPDFTLYACAHCGEVTTLIRGTDCSPCVVSLRREGGRTVYGRAPFGEVGKAA